VSHVKGGELYQTLFTRLGQFLEGGIKVKLLEQRENDPSHPLSLALFGNIALTTQKAPVFARQSLADSAETNVHSLSDRMSQTLQLMLARKFNKVSIQLSATYVHRDRILIGDQKTNFALGGAARIPISNSVAIILDYFHPFHTEAVEKFYKTPGT